MTQPEPSEPLAPWLLEQLHRLLPQRGHAWLLTGASGLGQWELSLALSRAWLCEQPGEDGACGHCAACHALAVHTHPDFFVLLPEAEALALGWPLDAKAAEEIDGKKRKPSKEIRVDALRDAVEFSQRTASRGRGRVMLIYPAERLNLYAANALLKTLEEPPGDLRFVLATEAAHALLPTLRSRCQAHTLQWPRAQQALPWLQSRGLNAAQAQVAWRASGGKPGAAWTLHQAGVDWERIPAAVSAGQTSAFKDWSMPAVVDCLQKLCHDCMATATGATPRFFLPQSLPTRLDMPRLSAWAKSLVQARATAEHPFKADLMLDALLIQAGQALNFSP